MSKLSSNIQIAYLLTILRTSWFWLGIWVLYYLRFTNYAGIGLIEMALFVTFTLSEIPTGAIADLFGKKKTLILSFVLQALGGFIMAFAPQLSWFVLSVIILGIGGSLFSGTLDALVYDSLLKSKEESKFPKIVSHMTSLSLATPAILGIMGGFLYKMDPRLPYLGNALCYSLAVIVCLFLIEPKIAKRKFSLQAFITQTQYGFRHLFKANEIRKQILVLLTIGLIIVMTNQMLDGFLSVEYGFKPEILGLFWATVYLLSALTSHFVPSISKRISQNWLILGTGVAIALSLLISPWAGALFGGLSILIRSCLDAINQNTTSVVINTNTPSEHRATTLSTFSLLQNIPYVLVAYSLGSLSDHYSAIKIASVLGTILLALLVYPSVQAVLKSRGRK